MKRLIAFCALLVLPVALSGQVRPGMTVDELLAAKGSPESKADAQKKSIYRWPDMEVTVANGKVLLVKRRNLAAERASAEERRKKVEALASQSPPPSRLSPEDKAEKLIGLREQLEHWKASRDENFDDYLKPDSVRRMADARRALAEAKITRIEREIEALARQ